MRIRHLENRDLDWWMIQKRVLPIDLGCGKMNWIVFVQDRIKLRAFVMAKILKVSFFDTVEE